LIWFSDTDPELSRKAAKIFERTEIRRNNPDVFALKRQFDDDSEDVLSFAEALQGRYVLYRPYYFDYENTVMRLELTLGTKGDPFYASLRHQYDARKYYRGFENYIFEGWMSPLPARNRAVANVIYREEEHDHGPEEKEGNQILYMDRVSNSGRTTVNLMGVALAIIGSSAATAWPFYARRLNDSEDFVPNLIPMSDPEITSIIADKLSLGAVKWKDYH